MKKSKIAVIGSGIAGLSLARHLSDAAEVIVFEHSAEPGGRMRSIELDGYCFDSGAQFFTARHPRFENFLKPYLETGLIAQWSPRVMTLGKGQKPYRRDWFEPHYNSRPHMGSLTSEMSQGLNIRYLTYINEIFAQSGWRLQSGDYLISERFDFVLLAIPAPQARALVPEKASFYPIFNQIEMTPCIALCLLFESPIQPGYQAAFVKKSDIDWLCIDSSKKADSSQHAMVVHASSLFSQKYWEENDQILEKMLLDRLYELEPCIPKPENSFLKRWQYAAVPRAYEEGFLLDSELRIGACGDWANSGRVEGAFMSGLMLGEQLKEVL